MKRFLIKYGVYLLLIAALSWLSSVLIDRGLRLLSGHSASQTSIPELLSDTLQADILIMGNSRALCSYDPLCIEAVTGLRTWNIGVSGQPFGISYLRYRLYREHNGKPKILLLNIDNNELEMIDNGFGREEYYPYFDNEVIQPYLPLYGFSWADIHLPLYKYRGDYKLIGYGLMANLGIYPFAQCRHEQGFYNENSAFDGSALEQVLQSGDIKVSKEPAAIQLLDSFLTELKEDSVKVLLCYAPQYTPLYERLEMDSLMPVYQDLADRHGMAILDYSGLEWCGDTCFFYNANHVNKKGAERFSTQLAEDLRDLISVEEISKVGASLR